MSGLVNPQDENSVDKAGLGGESTAGNNNGHRSNGSSAQPVGLHDPPIPGDTSLFVDKEHSPVELEDLQPGSEADPLYPHASSPSQLKDDGLRVPHCLKLVVVLVAVAFSCAFISALVDLGTPPPGGADTGRSEREIAEAVLSAMDRSADPCDDFYEYACGSWIRKTTIPKDRSTFQKSFSTVYEEIILQVRDMLENDLQAVHNKAGDFYASCLDQCASGPLKAAPLYRFRTVFQDLSSPSAFASALGVLHSNLSAGIFAVSVGVDEGSPDKYALYLSQGGLGLPSKDDYTSSTEKGIRLREVYQVEIQTMLAGAAKARLIPRFGHDVLAQQVIAFETILANISKRPDELRDPFKVYNKRTLKALPAGLSIEAYLQAAGVDIQAIDGYVILETPEYFDAVADMMKRVSTDVEHQRTVRAYLAFHLVRYMAGLGMLGESLFHAHFKFKKELYGTQKLQERWKLCQGLTTDFLGEVVGRAYVQRHFTDARRRAGIDMAQQVINAFENNLDKQDWMDKKTRASAKEKLTAVGIKMGYSTKWDTYDDAVINPTNYVANIVSASLHSWRRSIRRLGGPIDTTEWMMDAHEVNAYYSPPRNEIVIPAGILRQPFFSDAFPAAMNYGSLGAVVGHELSHGEDDAGRKYDASGMLRNWYSTQASKAYDERSQCYIDLYDTYKPRDLDVHLLGNLTLGENLADINGVKVAYLAFQIASMANSSLRHSIQAKMQFSQITDDEIILSAQAPPPNKVLAHELTNNQLFFVAFAQTYCMRAHPSALRVWVTTDPHSPGRFRVQGALSQTPEFADAFRCKAGSRYNPEHRCNLWM